MMQLAGELLTVDRRVAPVWGRSICHCMRTEGQRAGASPQGTPRDWERQGAVCRLRLLDLRHAGRGELITAVLVSGFGQLGKS